jgi:hypothetical protein
MASGLSGVETAVEKKTAGLGPAVLEIVASVLLCLNACLSGRRAVREPKVRKEEGTGKHGAQCITGRYDDRQAGAW